MGLHFGIVGLAFLTVFSVVIGLIFGPVKFFGYIIYLVGWMMSGHGLKLFWDFRLNATYAYALYFAYIFHRVLWKFFITYVDYIPNITSNKINNFLARFLTYIWVAFFFVGAWFMVGELIQYYAVEFTGINPVAFEVFEHFIHENPEFFQVALAILVIFSIVGMMWKIPFWMSREDGIESWSRKLGF